MNRRLVLEAPSNARDAAGGLVEGWTPVGDIWAAIEARSGRETVFGGRQGAKVTHVAEIRYAPPGSAQRPGAAQRFREGARVYAVLAVAEADARRERLRVWLSEGSEP